MPEDQAEANIRLHQRIDEVQHTCASILDALTYDRDKARPGILPRLDALETANAAAKKASLSVWSMDMGTYMLKVLLAALAMYLAASAKRGIVLDFGAAATSGVLDIVHARDGNKVVSR